MSGRQPSGEAGASVVLTVAVIVILLAAASLTIVIGGNAACGRPYNTFPPCASTAARPSPPLNSTPLIIAPEDQDETTLGDLANSIGPYLIPRDTVMLSSGAGSNNSTADASSLNNHQAELAPALPGGITFEARTSGLSNVRSVAAGLSAAFAGIIYDYEPDFEPEFTLDFATTLGNFENFSKICHAAGFKAFGYPFSQPLWNPADQGYGWNYGQLYATTGVDDLQIQLQGAAKNPTTWSSSILELVSQYAAYGLPASDLSVQLTIAQGDPNNIPVSLAYEDYVYAVAHGVGSIVLWWDEESLSDVLDFLGMIR